MDLHSIITEHPAGALRAALQAGADVEALDGAQRTPLMNAIEVCDLGKLRLLLDAGADPDRIVGDWSALSDAVDEEFTAGVAELLSRGVTSGLRTAGEHAHLRSAGQTPLPTLPPSIGYARTPDVLRLLLAAGENPQDADRDSLLQMLGRRHRAPLGQAAASYARDFAARRGTANPERIRSAFWREMIETGHSAFRARDTYGRPEQRPVWCHERFGRSLTPLPDGRIIGIAGEHEDYYDSDFYIYNDVIVYHPDHSVEIYGYPPDGFPPTDFHSATLVGGHIYIIGNFGYPASRQPGHTPVYRLDLSDMAIQRVETSGAMPGWIGKHRARYLPEHGAIYVWGGKTLDRAPAACGARLRLSGLVWEPVPWLAGAQT